MILVVGLVLNPTQMLHGSQLDTQAEPGVQMLRLSAPLKLKGEALTINSAMVSDNDISNLLGQQLFSPARDAVVVGYSGLCRATFHQHLSIVDENSNGDIRVVAFLHQSRAGEETTKYRQILMLPAPGRGEIHFTQLMRVKPGDKIKVVLKHMDPVTINLQASEQASNFTLEEVR